MTFSIVARSADGQAHGVQSHGVAVASKFLAVGSAVPAAQAEIDPCVLAHLRAAS